MTGNAATTPTAVVIEIIERGRATDGTTGGSALLPDDVRINGQSVLVPEEAPVIVHEITSGDLVTVTLTLFARSVSIRAENDPA